MGGKAALNFPFVPLCLGVFVFNNPTHPATPAQEEGNDSKPLLFQ